MRGLVHWITYTLTDQTRGRYYLGTIINNNTCGALGTAALFDAPRTRMLEMQVPGNRKVEVEMNRSAPGGRFPESST